MSSGDLPVPDDAMRANLWAALVCDVGERYRLHLERKDVRNEPRYVAVARSLNVRPYAVVTTDLDELRQALGQADIQPCTIEARSRRSEGATRDDGGPPLATPGGFI